MMFVRMLSKLGIWRNANFECYWKFKDETLIRSDDSWGSCTKTSHVSAVYQTEFVMFLSEIIVPMVLEC